MLRQRDDRWNLHWIANDNGSFGARDGTNGCLW
jgi:hypothetical protein